LSLGEDWLGNSNSWLRDGNSHGEEGGDQADQDRGELHTGDWVIEGLLGSSVEEMMMMMMTLESLVVTFSTG